MIEVYTLPDCSHCQEAKNYLKEKGISFLEINLKKKENREARIFWRSLGIFKVPVIVLKTDDKISVLKDYSKEKLEEWLKRHGEIQ